MLGDSLVLTLCCPLLIRLTNTTHIGHSNQFSIGSLILHEESSDVILIHNRPECQNLPYRHIINPLKLFHKQNSMHHPMHTCSKSDTAINILSHLVMPNSVSASLNAKQKSTCTESNKWCLLVQLISQLRT